MRNFSELELWRVKRDASGGKHKKAHALRVVVVQGLRLTVSAS